MYISARLLRQRLQHFISPMKRLATVKNHLWIVSSAANNNTGNAAVKLIYE